MTRYLTEPRDRIFVKGYGLLFFAKNTSKTIGKNISKSLSAQYSPCMLDAQWYMLNNLLHMHLKLF